jgi:hypothetical protein
MKWCRISTGIESVQVATDEIVYIRADGNYSDFVLTNGKVERRAIGRINDQLYFTATRHKETLWDFADALREYGFIDAIYITGGADYVFYRDKDGIRHDIGNPSGYPQKKWKAIIPWLVFRLP